MCACSELMKVKKAHALCFERVWYSFSFFFCELRSDLRGESLWGKMNEKLVEDLSSSWTNIYILDFLFKLCQREKISLGRTSNS